MRVRVAPVVVAMTLRLLRGRHQVAERHHLDVDRGVAERDEVGIEIVELTHVRLIRGDVEQAPDAQ